MTQRSITYLKGISETGDVANQTLFEDLIDSMHPELPALGAYSPAMTFNVKGQYSDYTPTSSTTVTFTATGIVDGLTQWVKIITDGTVTFAAGSGCELLSGSLGLLQAGTYKFGFGSIFGAVQIIVPGTEQTAPAYSFSNTHSMIIDALGEGQQVQDNSLHPNPSGTPRSFSWEIWYKNINNLTGSIILEIEDGTGIKYYLGRTNTDFIYAIFGTLTDYRTFTGNLTTSTSWQQIVLTFDGTSTVKIYKNATALSITPTETGTYAGPPQLSGNAILKIPYGVGGVYGNGKYNLVRQFNKVLSQAEVTNLYNSGVPKTASEFLANLEVEVPFNNSAGSNFGTNSTEFGTPTYDTDIPT